MNIMLYLFSAHHNRQTLVISAELGMTTFGLDPAYTMENYNEKVGKHSIYISTRFPMVVLYLSYSYPVSCMHLCH